MCSAYSSAYVFVIDRLNMNKFWKKFFTNGFNIALIAIQALALVFMGLMYVLRFFVYLFMLFESSFFIVWGIKILLEGKRVLNNADNYQNLPLTSEQKTYLIKRDVSNYKNVKFRGVMMIVVGSVLLFTIFYI